MLALTVPLVLASASPRRRALLAQIGLTPAVAPTGADETWPGGDPGPAVEALALRKARAATATGLHDGALVLAADTVVVLGDDVLNKPATPGEAAAMLRRLSGRTHTVYTGVALLHGGRAVTTRAATRVTFADLRDGEIDAYVATGSPMDKAGAYGIQDDLGALLVARIDGEYTNVVGLPLRTLYATLRDRFPDLLASTSGAPSLRSPLSPPPAPSGRPPAPGRGTG